MSLDNPTNPIIVTDTDTLQRKFQAAIFESVLGITVTFSDRLAVKLVEALRANCPTPPDLVDDLGGDWYWFAAYVNDDGSLRTRASLDDDPELSPVTEKET